ncbi:ABC transporter transmembrane domain-containing protein, partial [Acinetobacter baumannii]|uniref:ABC transporter transmembrane domain-containing protein n=1 Tax=Acinetobacter baumannii TaxID=470 RepID=UPI0031F3770A
YKKVLILDLFCASLTTVCEMVLPLILRHLTNTGLENVAFVTGRMIVSMGVLYFVLRIIDAIANYYMSSVGHIMGAKIETDMREDAFCHLQ